MSESTERVLNSRYRIDGLIGRGGMADVYRAEDLSLHRTVAVKMLRPDLARDPIFQTRFKREAQSSASLNHPNIVGVYDTGQAELPENGQGVTTPFIVMEFIDGVTLRHVLHGTPRNRQDPPPPPGEDDVSGDTAATTVHQDDDAASTLGSRREASTDSDVLGVTDDAATQAIPAVSAPVQEKIDHALGHPLSETEAAGYISGILEALSYSHSRGIVHRDIKPSNVMVGAGDDVKVMDFGIARALADSAQTMTQTSAVVGTAQYLSPEQARGEVVDHRSDLYSAGCVLFELLTNRPPFTGESPVSVAYQHVREDPPVVSTYNSSVSAAMESVVSKALLKDPALRFQTAEEFASAVQDALRGVFADEAATTQMAAVGRRGSFDDVVGASAAPGMMLSARTPEDPDIDDYSDYSAAAGRRPRRRRRGGAVLLWVLVGVLLVAGGAVLATRLLGGAGDTVAVPSVENLSEDQALSELSDAGLNPESQEQTHAEIEQGFVTGTDPAAGTDVDRGSSVVLFVSSGPESVTIPEDLIGQSEDAARATLENLGLEVGEVTEEDGSASEGEVLSSQPAAGETVDAGSSVNLTVASGMVELPAGVQSGVWREDVESSLNGVGISYELTWIETSDIDFDGEVLSVQVDGNDVSGGDRVPVTSAVIIRAGYSPPEEEDDEEDEDSSSDGDEDDEEDEDGESDESPEPDEEESPSPTDEPTEDADDSEDGDSGNGDSSNGNSDDQNNE